MLIGGMDVLGIYCIDSTPSVAKQVRSLKKNQLVENDLTLLNKDISTVIQVIEWVRLLQTNEVQLWKTALFSRHESKKVPLKQDLKTNKVYCFTNFSNTQASIWNLWNCWRLLTPSQRFILVRSNYKAICLKISSIASTQTSILTQNSKHRTWGPTI